MGLALAAGLAGLAGAQGLDPNLVAWLPLDEGTGTVVLDKTDYWNDGTLGGEPVWVAGRIGGALDLDGVNDYVDWGNKDSLNITGQITLAAWIRPETAGNGQHQSIILKGDRAYALKIQQWNNVEFFVYGGGWRACTFPLGSAAEFNNRWHYLAGTFDGQQLKLYDNGELRGTANYTGAIAIHTANTCLGRDADGGGRRYFNGIVDEPRIYNRALSADEIAKLANPERASSPSPSDGEVTTQAQVTLEWAPGLTAAQHRVYLGEDPAAVGPEAQPVATTDQAAYGPLSLEMGKTYSWRIDEVEADGVTVHTGGVWTFTIQPYTAYGPNPADGAHYVDVDADLAWNAGFNAQSHDLYFGMNRAAVAGADRASPLFKGNQTGLAYSLDTLENGKSYYWRVDEVAADTAVTQGPVWTFGTIPATPVTDPNLVGWWKLDDEQGRLVLDWSGLGHHAALVGNPVWVDGYVGGALDLDGFDDAVDMGNPDRLNLTSAVTVAAWIRPDGAANGEDQALVTKGNNSYGLNHTAGNNLRFRLSEAVVADAPVTSGFNGQWHHVTGTFDGAQLVLYVDGSPQATTDYVGAIPLSIYNVNIGREAVGNRYPYDGAVDEVRIYNRALAQDEIQVIMRGDPHQAWAPSPAHGAIADPRNAQVLTWSPGDGPAENDVYFGTDPEVVRNAGPSDTMGIYRGRQPSATYTLPAAPAWGQTYAWRVDEVAGDGTVTPGRLWSFTVADYLIVDNFEAYDDVCNRVYYAWQGGLENGENTDCGIPAYSGNGTGSVVGNAQEPWAERTLVYSGRQSMPMEYDNTASPFYSEAGKTWAAPQSWTEGGVDTLTVHVLGDAPAFLETAGTILMNGTGADIWGTADQFRFAYKRLTGNGSITARIDSLTNVNPSAKAGVMIRETLDEYSMHALVDITPSAGLEFIRRVATLGDSASTVQADLTAPYWVRLTRNGETFTAQCSADGVTWTSVGTDPAASIASIPMGQDVYIGLAVTSREAGSVCAATFSNISTTGTVTGAWENAGVGAVAQAAGNTPETFTVSVQDSAGKAKTVSHTDPAVIATGDWEQWDIPLSEFTSAGVNLGSVTKLTVGIGSPGAGAPGGSGKVYIDDIRLTKVGP